MVQFHLYLWAKLIGLQFPLPAGRSLESESDDHIALQLIVVRFPYTSCIAISKEI